MGGISNLIIINNYIHAQYTCKHTHIQVYIRLGTNKQIKKLFPEEMMFKLSLEEGALTWDSRRE